MTNKKTLIIILNWNKPQQTLDCAKSISKSSGSYDILIVDNGSSIENKKKLFEIFNKELNCALLDKTNINQQSAGHLSTNNIYIILSESNTGYARGNNIGIRFSISSGYTYSLISNNDIITPNVDTIAKLEEFMDHDTMIGWVSPKIINISGKTEGPFPQTNISELFLKKGIFFPFWFFFIQKKESLRYNEFNKKYESGDLTPYIFGGSFGMFRNTALSEVGLFDEKTFLYSEEQIISERLTKHGYSKKYVPETHVIHNHLYKNDGLNYKLEFIFLRSRIYYYTKYRDYSLAFVILGAFSRIFWLIFYKPAIIYAKKLMFK